MKFWLFCHWDVKCWFSSFSGKEQIFSQWNKNIVENGVWWNTRKKTSREESSTFFNESFRCIRSCSCWCRGCEHILQIDSVSQCDYFDPICETFKHLIMWKIWHTHTYQIPNWKKVVFKHWKKSTQKTRIPLMVHIIQRNSIYHRIETAGDGYCWIRSMHCLPARGRKFMSKGSSNNKLHNKRIEKYAKRCRDGSRRNI